MRTKVVLISLFNIDFGIRHIASYLESKGCHTDIIFFGMLRLKEEIFCNNYITPSLLHQEACSHKDAKLLIDLLLELNPTLIGITVPSTSFITATFLTQRIKERFDIPVVWGGIHATLSPEDCIEHADIVCIGEGEYPMHELAQRLEDGEEITSIKNLWIKHKDGSIEKNVLRDLISDLDSLPYPDFVRFGNKFIIDRGRLISDPIINSAYLKNVYPIMSSRGCHYHCSFCCNSVLKVIYKDKGIYLRRRSPENVIDELVYVRENREIIQIRFWDDIFTYDREWIEQFCQLYIKKVAVPFTCYAHPRYTDKRIIEMLARAGLISVDVGIQSGSESFCKEIFKREQSNEDIIKFARLLNRLGVIPRYNVIVDNPYESDADSDATAELLMKLPRPYTAALYSLCYFPKTELTHQALRDGFGFITEDQIEGKDNKALNNFYMFIDLAKDKKRFFWDTIMAMVISNFFSKKLIRRCKHSGFMRNHPRFLLSLVRLYLRISLILYIAIFYFILKKNTYQIIKLLRKAPKLFLYLAKLYIRIGILLKDKGDIFMLYNLAVNNLEKLTTEANNQTFRDKIKIDLLIFPKESIKTVSKSFYLKIRQREINQLLNFRMLVEMAGIRSLVSNEPRNRLGLWEIDFEIDDIDTEIEIDLLFPHLFFTQRSIRREASIREVRNIIEEGLYVIYFFIYDKLQKLYVLKNRILIHADDLLSLSEENKFLNLEISHLSVV